MGINHFEDFKIYLAGPIDFIKDSGVSFRNEITEKLIQLGIDKNQIYNPLDKPVKTLAYKDFDVEKEHYYTLRKHQMWDDLEKLAKLTLHVDLRLVDKSDVIIAVIKPEIPLFGTIHEIVSARQQKKPVLLIDPRGREGTSIWAIGLCGYKHIFSTIDSAIDYLSDVLHGKIEVDQGEWLFLNFKNGKK